MFAFKYTMKGAQICRDLFYVTEEIQDYWNNNDLQSLTNYYQKENIFEKSAELKKVYNEFKKRSNQLENDGSDVKADISDYINYDFIEESINAPFMNQIPGIMVGLGILGTFLGLSIGLNTFTIGNDAKELITAIQPLMDGIKVAFHTSIYGMIYSLLFNFKYRRDLFILQQAVDQFLDSYENHVVSITNNGSQSTSVRYQEQMAALLEKQTLILEKQNNSLETMTRTLSSAFNVSSNNIINYLSDKLEETYVKSREDQASVMESVLLPEIKKLSDSLSDFTEEVAADQSENLSRLVNEFISQMNDVLSVRFVELGEVIDQTNSMQTKSLQQMELVLDSVSTMAVDLGVINSSLESTITRIESYASSIEAFNDTVNTSLMNLNIQTDVNNEILKTQAESLGRINEMLESVNKDMKSFSEETERIIEETHTHNRNFVEKISDLLLQRERELEESYTKADQLMADRMRELTSSTQQIVSDAYKANTEHAEQITRIFTESETKLEENYIRLDNLISERISALEKDQNLLSQDISEAGRQLSGVLNEINSLLGKRTEETFIIFDRELAEISRHLSGTIQQIDGKLDKIPLAVNGVFSDMDDRFKEMQYKLDQYLEYTDKLHHNVESKLYQLQLLENEVAKRYEAAE